MVILMGQQQLSLARRVLCALRTWHVDLATAWIKQASAASFEVTNLPTIVFSPHQDDETLGCGGLIALKRSQGIPVQVVFLTNGDAYTGGHDGGLAKVRQQEALDALAILGVPASEVIFWDYPDGQLRQISADQRAELITSVTQVLSSYDQAEVYVPHAYDRHDDHEVTYEIVRSAIEQLGRPHSIYQYPIWIFWKAPLLVRLSIKQLQGWRRLNIQSVLAQKQTAMAAHQSQMATLPPGFINRFLRSEELFY
jgi:N-acetylglucosamine malate deacetylase 1